MSTPSHPGRTTLRAAAVGGLAAGLLEGSLAGGGALAVVCVAGVVALAAIGLGIAAAAVMSLHSREWWSEQGGPWLVRGGPTSDGGWRIIVEASGWLGLAVALGAWGQDLWPGTPDAAVGGAAPRR